MPLVSRPARYIGNEWNSVHKDHRKQAVKIALAFPDVYEVGMSHLGLSILYHLLNAQEGVVAERTFSPWVDMENLMRERRVPLFSLESHLPLKEFDIIGFTLPYELCYTNILNMLDLTGIALQSRERDFPLIIAGGIGAFNPEPLAPFIDAFVLGDGEEVILEIVERCKGRKIRGSKEELLRDLARLEGVYVPSFYDVSYNEDGTIKAVKPKEAGVPCKVRKRVVADLNQAFYPTATIVPYLDIIHDRVTLEVMRGCGRGCRFCQAGVLYRPVREREVKLLTTLAEESVKRTGYGAVSLSSLSTGDYRDIEVLVRQLRKSFPCERVSLSLSSLHVGRFSLELVSQLKKGSKSGFTFAPEAGTERLRSVINKQIMEEDLFNTLRQLHQAGWRKVKLYFMIGLPTEEREDLEGIINLVNRATQAKVRLSLSVSSFVPKAHTPFQWEGMAEMEGLREKQKFLQKGLRNKGVEIKWHEVGMSFLEAVFARGDRRLSKVILKAWEKGCRFDGWREHFRFQLWSEAFEESGIAPRFYANRVRHENEILPWDHLDTGVDTVKHSETPQSTAKHSRSSAVRQCRFTGSATHG